MALFNFLAGVASILGLGFSVWAVVEVRRLRSRVWLRSRLPVLIGDLTAHGTNLSDLTDESDLDDARNEVGQLEATLGSITENMAGTKEATELLSWLRTRQPLRNVDQVPDIYRRVTKLARQLENRLRDDSHL